MDRAGSFLLGVLTGAALVLGLRKLLDDRELSLESLEESIEHKLDELEGHWTGEPALN